MSCNGCRVLRKGCSDSCILRPCLQWIESAEAQGHATVFVAKFFGRAGLMNFLNSVPEQQRPSLFQSLLFEACGRTVNPVNGAVGLLWTGNWHVCQAAVETVLRGGVLRPAILDDDSSGGMNRSMPHDHASAAPDLFCRSRGPNSAAAAGVAVSSKHKKANNSYGALDCNDAAARASKLDASDLDLCLSPVFPRRPGTPSEDSVTTSTGSGGSGGEANGHVYTHAAPQIQQQPTLLNLFV